MQEWNKVRAESRGFSNLPMFTVEDLQIECGAKNEFPTTVLSGLAPFILEPKE